MMFTLLLLYKIKYDKTELIYVIKFQKHFGEERKPTLSTDEEESGSTTSSCDELDRPLVDDSDTASAPSPALHNDTSSSSGM